MKLIDEITVFPLISTFSLYSILNLLGEVLIRGQRLTEGGAYFKVKEIHMLNFKTLFLSFSTMKMKYKTSKQNKKKATTKQKKKMKTLKYQQ